MLPAFLLCICVALAAASEEIEEACALQLVRNHSGAAAVPIDASPEYSLVADNSSDIDWAANNSSSVSLVEVTGSESSAVARPSIDLLEITSIQCKKPAGGMSAVLASSFSAVAGVIAAGASLTVAGVVVGSGGTAVPLTMGALSAAGSAAGGAAGAVTASLNFLDKEFSGEDHLVVKVNGENVLPKTGNYKTVKAGEKVNTDIKVSFQGHARIALIEYDWGSDNDDLGHLDIAGGMDTSIDQAFIAAPHEEDGSIYLVSYKVHKGKGDPKSVVGYMLCGTNQCDACFNPECEHQPYDNLDRDKDHEDLKRCPPGMSHSRYIRYPQWWPAADVYLRVCERDHMPHWPCDAWFFQHGWFDGRHVRLGPGRYDYNAILRKGIKNDDISSIKVGPGCRVTLYQHGNFDGYHGTFTHGDYRFPEFIKKVRNDDVSSIVVEKV